jgi:exonuclease 3'-5' domain-containing protein 1
MSSGKKLISFDAEGVNLSRIGPLTVISIGIEVSDGVHVFIFDMMNQTLKHDQLEVLKYILEDSSVLKIIHDCRQDSDALISQFNIRLASVFDTSIYHMNVEREERRANLNTALNAFSCALNPHRDDTCNMYRLNPNFWAVRPLTASMVQYASKDVSSLFELREKILAKAALTMSPHELSLVAAQSEQAVDEFCAMKCHQLVQVAQESKGRVIGKGGAGIARIMRTFGVYTKTTDQGFLVLAKDRVTLLQAVAAIKKSLN